ncbi:hypothetical protein [Allobranchiibius sp. GilTou73]|uniref:hypothetical protein n=1 Tax=Allobranchiibius sp. GilTou73 TaxID=2904523 RepID=UPI001F36DCA3|nr:hypothetical protein [Allobranchiibius sp. GilTou73]UIJ34964.1 hypothetical protein LVQ62_00680 [Allobranchiibius sp. GilTou73]
MLLLVTGSSCSGQTTAARLCADLPQLAVHDSDEHGVPSDADTAWRQRDLRRWVQEAIRLEQTGTDLLLTGQSPIGELLAVPEADRLPTAVLLMDVEDPTRWRRLEERDPGKWSREEKRAFVGWARWHRAHAVDAAFHPEVLTEGAAAGMRWDRWLPGAGTGPSWMVEVINTTEQDVTTTAAALRDWVSLQRSQNG